MTTKNRLCIDCSSEAVSHNKTRLGKHLVTEEFTFSCGATQREHLDAATGTGTVHFEGCGCGTD